MDRYIYKPPPPPPPPQTQAPQNDQRGPDHRRNRYGPKRPGGGFHPYNRQDAKPAAADAKPDGDLALVSPAVLEASKDIDAWIAERRKRFPTAERIKEKEAEQKEKAQSVPEKTETKPNVEKESPATNAGNSKEKRGPPICKYFQSGKCRKGNNCKFAHTPKDQSTRLAYKRFEPPSASSLFVKLVQRDMEADNAKVLDFVQFLNEHGLLASSSAR